jgi:hypothetical protein
MRRNYKIIMTPSNLLKKTYGMVNLTGRENADIIDADVVMSWIL